MGTENYTFAAVKLQRLYIGNFRSCKSTHFDFAEPLTVLIGENGVGKSNIFESLRALNALANESPKAPSPVPKSLEGVTEIRCTFEVDSQKIELQALFVLNPKPKVFEKFSFKKINWRIGESAGWEVIPFDPYFFNYKWDQDRIDGTFRGHVYSARQLDGQTKPPALSAEKIKIVRSVQDFFRRIKFVSASQFANPKEHPTEIEINEIGQLLSAGEGRRFLYSLYQAYFDKTPAYAQLESILGKNGLNVFDRIKFHKVNFPQTSVEVWDNGQIKKVYSKKSVIVPRFLMRGNNFSLSQLSDGTLRFLGLTFSTIDPAWSLLLIEEPEVSIHHGLLNSLVELFKVVSSNGRPIVINTHSDYILDLIEPENVIIVSISRREGTSAESLVKKIGKNSVERLKNKLRTSVSLGEIWRDSGFKF